MHGKSKDKGGIPSLAQVMGKMWCHLQRWGAGSGEDGDLTFRPAGFETHKWKHLASSPCMDQRFHREIWDADRALGVVVLGIIEAVGVDEVIEKSISQPSVQHSYCFGKHPPHPRHKKN